MDPVPQQEKFLDPDWVEQVLMHAKPTFRGHMVCLSYSKLALFLDEVLHPKKPQEQRRETNWFNYATWGTVTVTRNIGLQRPPLIDTALPFASPPATDPAAPTGARRRRAANQSSPRMGAAADLRDRRLHDDGVRRHEDVFAPRPPSSL